MPEALNVSMFDVKPLFLVLQAGLIIFYVAKYVEGNGVSECAVWVLIYLETASCVWSRNYPWLPEYMWLTVPLQILYVKCVYELEQMPHLIDQIWV